MLAAVSKTLPLIAAALLALLLLAEPSVALARSPKQRAQALFAQGNRLRKAGNHEGALQRFRAAYKLFPSFKIDLNIAFALYDLKRNPEAAVSFSRFLREGARRSPRRIVRLARSRLVELRRKVASIRLRCSRDGAAVLVDGRRRGTTPLPAEVYLEPGRHRIELVLHGYQTLVLNLDLPAGEHPEQTVELVREKQQRPDERPDVEPDPAPAADPIVMERYQRKTTVAYITLGTGLALAATAGIMIGLGISSGTAAHDQYVQESRKLDGNSAVIAGHREDVENARSMVIAGDVLAGVAAVSLGFSIYQFLTRPRLEDRQTSPTITVAPSPGGAALLLNGRF